MKKIKLKIHRPFLGSPGPGPMYRMNPPLLIFFILFGLFFVLSTIFSLVRKNNYVKFRIKYMLSEHSAAQNSWIIIHYRINLKTEYWNNMTNVLRCGYNLCAKKVRWLCGYHPMDECIVFVLNPLFIILCDLFEESSKHLKENECWNHNHYKI
jgi:hypothetical protein